jgi:hypothetical protein
MSTLHAPKEIVINALFQFPFLNLDGTTLRSITLRHYGIIVYYGIMALRHLRFTVFNYGDYGMCRNRINNFDSNYNPNYSFLLKIIKMLFTIKLRNQFIKIYIKKYLHINIRSTRIYDQRNYYKN